MIIESKVSSKGQITIPARIRKALGVKPGDKVALCIDENGEITIVNAKVVPLIKIQEQFKGVAEELGVKTDEDVVEMIKEIRRNDDK